jgi:hypothetical protein
LDDVTDDEIPLVAASSISKNVAVALKGGD